MAVRDCTGNINVTGGKHQEPFHFVKVDDQGSLLAHNEEVTEFR